MKAWLGASGILAMVLHCTGCQTVRTGTAPEVSHESPRQLFTAYGTAISRRDYPAVLDCMIPSLRPGCDVTLYKMKRFEEKSSRLAEEIEARFGSERAEDFERGVVARIEQVFERAFHWRRGDIDFGKAEYLEREGRVWAIDRGTPFGLMAVKYKGSWHLAHPRSESFLEDLAGLRVLLDGFNRFVDRTYREIQSGKIDNGNIEEVLARPHL